jgi:hypothetical protein
LLPDDSQFRCVGVARRPLFEALEPLVEILGFAITLVILHAENWTYVVAFFLIATLTGETMSATALLVEEIGFRRYRATDLLRLTAWGLVESVWFRPPMAWWRLKATLFALIGRRPGRSTIPRGATLEQPTQAVAPLTR